jgi:hypothetical protein
MRRQNTFPLRKVRTGPGAAAAALAAVPGRLGKSRSADQPVDLQLPPAVPAGRTRGMETIKILSWILTQFSRHFPSYTIKKG